MLRKPLLVRCLWPALIAATLSAAHGAPRDLSGTVVMSDGKPAAGAFVRVLSLDCQTQRLVSELSMSAGPEGAFHFAVPESMTMQNRNGCGSLLLFAAKGAETIVMNADDDRFKTNILPLQPATPITVQLIDQDGKPVKGQTVSLEMIQSPANSYACQWSQSAGAPWAAVTDSSGKATLQNVPCGGYVKLNADSPSYVSDEDIRFDSLVAKPPVRIIHLAKPGTVAGMLFYSGTNKPVPNTGILLTRRGFEPSQYEAQTDQDGVYSIDQLRPGSYTISPLLFGAVAEDWAGAARAGVVVKPGDHVTNVDLTLIKGGLLTGRVTDKTTGNPAPDSRIDIRAEGDYNLSASPTIRKDGSYRIRLAPGRYAVQVAAGENGVPLDENSASVAVVDGAATTHDFTVDALSEQRRISGVVVDAAGSPIAGASVTLSDNAFQQNDAVTDAQGKFDFPFARSGNTLFASTTDFLASAPIKVAEGDAPIKIVLDHPGAFAEGVVADQDGNPIADAQVSLTRWTAENGGEGYQVGKAVSGKDGRYRVGPTYAGMTYSVDARASGFIEQTSDHGADFIAASADSHLGIKPITLAKLDSTVSGVVLDQDDKPLAGAFVAIAGNSENSVVSDKAGRFSLPVASRARLYLWGRKDGYDQGPALDVSAGETDVELTLAKSEPPASGASGDGSISGRVVDQYGKPAATASVSAYAISARAGAGYGGSARTDADGRFQLTGLGVSDSYSLAVGAVNYMMAEKRGVTAVKPGGDPMPDIVIDRLDSTISGKLVDASRAPVAGATVYVAEANEERPVRSDDAGAFTVPAAKGVQTRLRAYADAGLIGAGEYAGGAAGVVLQMAVPARHGDGTPAKTVLANALAAAAKAGKGVFVCYYQSEAESTRSGLPGDAALVLIGKYFVIADIDTYEYTAGWANAGWQWLRDPKTGARLNALAVAAYDPSGVLHGASKKGLSSLSGLPALYIATLREAAPSMTDDDARAIESDVRQATEKLSE